MELVWTSAMRMTRQWLDDHLSERGLSIEDVVCVASFLVPRRKGATGLDGYGRGVSDRPIVVQNSAQGHVAGARGRRGRMHPADGVADGSRGRRGRWMTWRSDGG